jgi:hypothetical protein
VPHYTTVFTLTLSQVSVQLCKLPLQSSGWSPPTPEHYKSWFVVQLLTSCQHTLPRGPNRDGKQRQPEGESNAMKGNHLCSTWWQQNSPIWPSFGEYYFLLPPQLISHRANNLLQELWLPREKKSQLSSLDRAVITSSHIADFFKAVSPSWTPEETLEPLALGRGGQAECVKGCQASEGGQSEDKSKCLRI